MNKIRILSILILVYALIVSCSTYKHSNSKLSCKVDSIFEKLDTSWIFSTSKFYDTKWIKTENGDSVNIEKLNGEFNVRKMSESNAYIPIATYTKLQNGGYKRVYNDNPYEYYDFKNKLVIYKEYYPNGNIKCKGLRKNNQYKIGKWYYFEESGKCIRIDDYDKGYCFSYKILNNLLKINRIDPEKAVVEKSAISDKKKFWFIYYKKKYANFSFKISGKTGCIVSKKREDIFVFDTTQTKFNTEFERVDTTLHLPNNTPRDSVNSIIKTKSGDTLDIYVYKNGYSIYRSFVDSITKIRHYTFSDVGKVFAPTGFGSSGYVYFSGSSYDRIKPVGIDRYKIVVDKEFYLNGNIKSKGLRFEGAFEIGKWYYFDDSGNTVNIVDYEEGFTYNYIKLFEYLNKKKLFYSFSPDENGVTHISRSKISEKKKYWIVEYWKRGYEITLKISGKTGRVISKEKRKVQFIE